VPDATVHIDGLEELQRALKASDRAMAAGLRSGLSAAGQTVRSEAQQRVPYVTGKLSRAIRPGSVQGTGLAQSIEVGIAPGMGSPSRGRSGPKGAATNPSGGQNTSDPQVYGPVVERGSGPRVIRPRTAKALRFTVGGSVVFAKVVNHPGTRAKPFLVPALTENVDLVSRRIFTAIERVVADIARKSA
jgi:hypothetical protein